MIVYYMMKFIDNVNIFLLRQNLTSIIYIGGIIILKKI